MEDEKKKIAEEATKKAVEEFSFPATETKPGITVEASSRAEAEKMVAELRK